MTNVYVIGITCAFMCADIVTGFLKAWQAHDIQSRALRAGLFHKAAFLGVIGIAQLTELAADKIPQIELDVPITGGICAYIILTEIVSVLENLRDINPDIGGVLNRFPAHPSDEPTDPPQKPDKE
ncbi:phage holin family protein [Bifidobacterium choerinum]|uniref:Holin n=1 Tax=Bifidobacterium choerinum TaxID=35760 RepID=A0A2D3D2X8_9BIFI|nr:phage holin family protein [Bifidobacterium choerinum]ATU19821.1 hypothetical protein BcFMB_01450 [Bifidobacterium choerinum]